MGEELISIIVPVYNAESSLRKCVDSLIKQTYKKIEIILVDDGSRDKSAMICDEYAQLDQRVVVIHQENQGVSVARNKGIEKSTGVYIMFVDSDDWVDEKIVEILYNSLVENQSDISICSHYVVTGEEDYEIEQHEDVYISNSVDIAYYLKERWILIHMPWGALYKRKKVGEFRVGMSYGEDTLFKLNYFAQTNSLVIISHPLYYYKSYNNSGSLTNKFSPDYLQHYIFLIEQSISIFGNRGISQKDLQYLNLLAVSKAFYFLYRYIETHDAKNSLEYAKAICGSDTIRAASRYTIGKHGLIIDVFSIFLYLRMPRCMVLMGKLRNHLRSNK